MGIFFRSLKLSHRFALLIGIFVLGFSVYCAWSFKTLNELKVNGPVYQHIVQGKDLIADVLPPPEYIIESYLVSSQLAAAASKEEQDRLAERLRSLKSEYDARHDFWIRQDLDPDLKRLLLAEAHAPALDFYKAAFEEYIPALRKQDKDTAAAAMARMVHCYEKHRKAIDQVVQLVSKRNEQDERAARERINQSTWLMLATFAISLGVGIAVGAAIVRGVLASLGGEPEYAAEISRHIAAGDLTMNIDLKPGDRNSLMCSMKAMQEMLAKTVLEIQTAADVVSSGAEQIASGNQNLAARTEEQATSLERTSVSMAKQVTTIKRNSDSAAQANALAEAATKAAVKGGSVMSEVVGTMGRINDSSKRIVDIIGVIEGIAFQTNILALNAAVEAARAGEQGKGFAVVAAEVRSLAQRSANAAKEIKDLIGGSVEQVDVGAHLVEQAGSAMDEILAGVKRVNDIICEINAASREQTDGIEHINLMIGEMDSATQQNASLVEQTAAAAESLQEQTSALVKIARVFKLGSGNSTMKLPDKQRPPLSLVA